MREPPQHRANPIQRGIDRGELDITSAEYQLEQAPSDDEDEDQRRRLHVEHLVEAGKFAVRAAAYTTEEIERRRQRDA